ncbi:MAG: ATP-binding cassette domain-containing protein [Firmicutes bacterium]|nr:ATP-binding cassette domain-containing protein [Bacillota bacterium]
MFAVRIENFRYTYPGGERPALDVDSFAVHEGEFTLIVGGSGSGKSTLLRAIRGLVPVFHGGSVSGLVEVFGRPVSGSDPLSLAQAVGMVFQDPESQLFMTSVEREVAFGLQNLGWPTDSIGRCVAEALNYLGITHLRGARVTELSGGEKQKVALASVVAMQPRILLLDEPTSQLDPVAADDLVGLLKRINKDSGTTVIMTEQRLDRCFYAVDTVWLCDAGEVMGLGEPPEAARNLIERGVDSPSMARLFGEREGVGPLPLTVREGRDLLARNWTLPVAGSAGQAAEAAAGTDRGTPVTSRPAVVIELTGLTHLFDGERGIRPALSGIDLTVREGEFVAVLGENGAGKSTLLRVMAGLTKPSQGRVRVAEGDGGRGFSGVAWLSQNPNDHLTADTVREEVAASIDVPGSRPGGRVERVLDTLGLTRLLDCNPRDLSSGERERAAIAATIARSPRLLLLDEPTRGMDRGARQALLSLLRDAITGGASAVMVTHDVDMAAECASRVIVMSGGRIVADGPPRMVLDGALFYSPQVNRLFRHWVDGVISYGEALALLGEGWRS